MRLLAIFLGWCLPIAFAIAAPADFVGGSDYPSYKLEGCKREPYGVISGYGAAHEVIDQQLRKMYAGGQRRLRIPVFFSHGIDNGTILDSSHGALLPNHRLNLQALLASVKRIGFEEVEIGFFPIRDNSPMRWGSWNETLYRENLSVILDVRPVILASKLAYRIDLLNEGTPDPKQQILLQYDRRLWADYTSRFGPNDTVGFSVIPSAARIEQIRNVYGAVMPKAFDLHPYDNAQRVLEAAHVILSRDGLGSIPWIIGESYYNDAREAQEIDDVVAKTRHRILFLLQWPLNREHSCNDVDVLPLDFTQYRRHGF